MRGDWLKKVKLATRRLGVSLEVQECVVREVFNVSKALYRQNNNQQTNKEYETGAAGDRANGGDGAVGRSERGESGRGENG